MTLWYIAFLAWRLCISRNQSLHYTWVPFAPAAEAACTWDIPDAKPDVKPSTDSQLKSTLSVEAVRAVRQQIPLGGAPNYRSRLGTRSRLSPESSG